MGKYSSDSDSDSRHRKKSHRRTRRSSSSSDSDDSRSRHRDRRSRRRSKSRDRFSKSRRSRSSSQSYYKSSRKSSTSSRAKDKYKHSSSERRRRSYSKERRRSRSGSKSYIREFVSKKRSSSSSSSSSSDYSDKRAKVSTSKRKTARNEGIDARTKIEDPDVVLIDEKAVEEINSDNFVQKNFSSKGKKTETIVIDLKKQIIKVPEVEPVELDSIFHHNLFMNEESRIEKWVKELYSYRQKALQQGLRN